jgi:hypothetical protein
MSPVGTIAPRRSRCSAGDQTSLKPSREYILELGKDSQSPQIFNTLTMVAAIPLGISNRMTLSFSIC